MSDKGSVTTVAPTAYIGVINRKRSLATLPVAQSTAPTVPTVGQIWPRGNQIQR